MLSLIMKILSLICRAVLGSVAIVFLLMALACATAAIGFIILFNRCDIENNRNQVRRYKTREFIIKGNEQQEKL